jgi:glucose uptake protein GlcU
MAMRPNVLRHTIIIIVFSVVQWGFMRYILNHQLFNLDTYQRILYFSMSSFIAGFFYYFSTDLFGVERQC